MRVVGLAAALAVAAAIAALTWAYMAVQPSRYIAGWQPDDEATS